MNCSNDNNSDSNFDRYITTPIYTSIPPDDLKLTDNVAIFNDGTIWKIIPLKVLAQTPIIYDILYESLHNGHISIPLTITFCPFTHTLIIFKNKVCLHDITKPNIKLYNDNTNIFYQLNGTGLRHDILCATLREALSTFPDCTFLNNRPNIEPYNIKNINKIDFGIEYASKYIDKNGYKKNKYVILLSPGLNNLNTYLDKVDDTLIEKTAIIIPTTFKSWKKFHPNTKIIKNFD